MPFMVTNVLRLFAVPPGGDPSCYSHFLGLAPWYQYLVVTRATGTCEVQNFHLLGSSSSLLLILLVIVDDLLALAGLFAVIYIIYAGFKYVMSQGSPDETGKALTSIRNAITGLVIAIIATPLVAYLASQFVGAPTGPSGRISGLDLSNLPFVGDIANGKIVSTLLSVAFNILGALSVLFVVIGGYNYVISNGEPTKAGKAKSTILYALIGLTVAIVAQSIVSFVVNHL